jgi:hypothetical protein
MAAAFNSVSISISISVGIVIYDDIVNSFTKPSLSPRYHLTPESQNSGKRKTNQKRNSLAHPRPGHHHPPDLFRLCARSESDEVDEGAGLVGRGDLL